MGHIFPRDISDRSLNGMYVCWGEPTAVEEDAGNVEKAEVGLTAEMIIQSYDITKREILPSDPAVWVACHTCACRR